MPYAISVRFDSTNNNLTLVLSTPGDLDISTGNHQPTITFTLDNRRGGTMHGAKFKPTKADLSKGGFHWSGTVVPQFGQFKLLSRPDAEDQIKIQDLHVDETTRGCWEWQLDVDYNGTIYHVALQPKRCPCAEVGPTGPGDPIIINK